MDNTTLTLIGVIIAAIPGLVALYFQKVKLKPETQILDADAAGKYEALVARAATREAEYQNRLDAMQVRLNTLEDKYSELESKLAEANKRAEKFEGWAKRLAHQVQALGGVPVPLDCENPK